MDLFSDKGLSFERLQSLVRVHEAGGLAKASPGNVVRQNLIGRQLRELESFFHIKLTEKRGKVLILNEQGKELAALARANLLGLEDFKRSALSRRKRLRIAAGGSLYSELLAPRLAQVAASDEFELYIRELVPEKLFELLLQGDLDLGIAWQTPFEERQVQKVPLGRFRYALFGARQLIRKARSLENLRQLPLALVEYRDMSTAVASQLGSNLVVHVDENSAALRLVQSRRFIAVLPELYAGSLPPREFSRVRLDYLRQFERDIGLFWNAKTALIRGVPVSWIHKVAGKLLLT